MVRLEEASSGDWGAALIGEIAPNADPRGWELSCSGGLTDR